jgi:hypothetical protein
MQEEMDVGIDEAGHQGRVAEVDLVRAVGMRNGRSDLDDTFAAN